MGIIDEIIILDNNSSDSRYENLGKELMYTQDTSKTNRISAQTQIYARHTIADLRNIFGS